MRKCTMSALLIALAMSAARLQAQQVDSATFVPLRADGNGVSSLASPIGIGFTTQPAKGALLVVAALAQLNLTLPTSLPELDTRITVKAHDRTAAAALLEIAKLASLGISVSPRGQLIVGRAPPVVARQEEVVGRMDSVARAAALLPTQRVEASRIERLDFSNSANVSGISISGAALRSSPAFVEPDLLKSIQLMPGIASRSDWTAGFNVRGGEADQALILMDGYPIYNPFHLGGVFSTFIDPMVGRVELFTGSLPSRFGGRLSGALDVHSAVPADDQKHGTAELSLISTYASLGRTFDDGNGEWMVAARRTYADAVVNLFKRNGFPYHFQDVNGHFARNIGGGVRLSMTGYAGLDIASGERAEQGTGGWGNDLVGATLSKAFHSSGDSVVAEQRFSVTRFGAHVDFPQYASSAHNDLTDLRTGGELARYAGSAKTTLGYELSHLNIAYSANSTIGSFGDLIPFDSLGRSFGSLALYANHLWRPGPKWLVDLGGRFEAVEGTSGTGFSPRLSAKYFLSDNMALTAGAGRYTQWVHSLGREEEPLQPLQFWVAGDAGGRATSMNDVAVGMERWINPGRLLHIGTFYKRYTNLLLPNPYSDAQVTGDEFAPVTGASYGVDVLLRELEGGDFSGWVSYSYAFNTRTDASGFSYFPSQDRRHNLNLVGSWRGDSYTLGLRANIASGLPTTPVLGGFARDHYDATTHRWVADRFENQHLIGGQNSDRLPFYERVDASLTRNGRLFGLAVSPYLSVVNLFNSQNPAAYLYSFDARAQRASFPNLPFVPTFGVSIAY